MNQLTYELAERGPGKKPMTIIRGLEDWRSAITVLKDLKTHLDCNGCLVRPLVNGETEYILHLQGDQRERAPVVLSQMPPVAPAN